MFVWKHTVLVDNDGKKSRKTIMLFDKMHKGDTIDLYKSGAGVMLKAKVVSDGTLERVHIARVPKTIKEES